MAFLIWNPSKEALIIPYIEHPIAWYGIIFAIGFFVALLLFIHIFYRFLLTRPYFTKLDLHQEAILQSEFAVNNSIDATLHSLNMKLREPLLDRKKLLDRGLGFIKRCLPDYRRKLALNRLVYEKSYSSLFKSLKSKAKHIGESLIVYVVIGTIIGARIGHILFYENISFYLHHPIFILKVWEGGLASHGGIVGILIALIFFYAKFRNEIPRFHPILLLDLMVIPSAFVAFCIRIGNFINQEILGLPTNLPWGVVFLNPIDGSAPIPRHPVQLYEAFFYLVIFACLLIAFYRFFPLLKVGFLSGFFFISVFVFRFFIEFFKERQSLLIGEDTPLLMGQILSLPFILFGLALIIIGRRQEKI